jgi:ubiquinone/menaquinone biosynthesis C-methylase UbiE
MSSQDRPTAASHFNKTAEAYERTTGGCTLAVIRAILRLPEMQSIFTSPTSAIVLDNACGTALASEEIIKQLKSQSKPLPYIHAADPAENMITIATAKFSALCTESSCTAATMPGENLTYADGTFTHSITNLGLLFYEDAAAGAHEIFRTLKPDGSVAVVTTWERLGYMEDVIRPAHKLARPQDEKQFTLPISDRWFEPEQVRQCLVEDGGFAPDKVQMQTCNVYYAAPNHEELAVLLLEVFAHFYNDWAEDEKVRFGEAVRECLIDVAVECMLVDGTNGVGVPMKAIVAICER